MAPKRAISQKSIKKSKPSPDINSNRKRRRHHEESPDERMTIECNESNTEKCEILLLNNDCLLEIFAHLSVVDLFYARKCCRRFKELADFVAPKQCQKEEFHYVWQNEKHKKLLECYGKFMPNITFERITDAIPLSDDIDLRNGLDEWNWLSQCASLKTLTIRNMNLIYDERFNEVYEGLESLSIEDCPFIDDINGYEHVIRACKNLKSIQVLNGAFRLDWIDAVNLENISIRLIDLIHCFLFGRFSDELLKLTKLKYLLLDVPCCDYFASLLSCLHESLPLEQLVLGVKRGIEFNHSMLAEALEKLQKVKLCQIRYYAANDALGFSNAKSLVQFMQSFNVSIGYHGSQPSNDNYFEIKLQRKI